MKTLNPNIFPKGGHGFKESDGTFITGSDWNGVVARVKLYRQRAGLPIGDPQGEVIAQACAKNPVLCIEEDSSNKEQVKRASLRVRVLKYLVFLTGLVEKNEAPFVGDAVAHQRADICAKCPKNQGLQEGCASCKAAITESRDKILGGRFRDARLNECVEMGEDLPVSIHIDHQAVEGFDLPDFCWRRRSL